MSFSHRDRRIHRFLWRTLGTAAGVAVVLGGLVLYDPSVALSIAGLLGLAALGAATMSVGERAVAEYERDLRAVRGGGPSNRTSPGRGRQRRRSRAVGRAPFAAVAARATDLPNRRRPSRENGPVIRPGPRHRPATAS